MPSVEGIKGIEYTGLREFLDNLKRDAPRSIRWGLVISTWIYLFSPIFTIYVPLPAFLLPTSLRDKHTHRFSTHRFYLIRSCALMIKMLAGMCWGRDPEIRSLLGCDALPPDPGTFRVGE